MARLLLSLVALTLTASGAAAHAESWRGCPEDQNFFRCVLSRAGAPTIEAVRERGDSIVRVLVSGLYPYILIDVVRPKRGNGYVIVRDPREHDIRRRYTFKAQEFEPFVQRVLAAMPRPQQPTGARTVENVCIDGAEAAFTIIVEGEVTYQGVTSCEPEYAVVEDVAKFAATLDPAFPILSDERHRPEDVLLNCLRLSGDRVLAARVFRIASDIHTWVVPDERPTDTQVARAIRSNAALRFGQLPPVIGGRAILKRQQELGYFIPVSAASHGRTIVVRGYHERNIDTGEFGPIVEFQRLHAPSEQTWHLDDDGSIRMVEWRIDSFISVSPYAY